MLQFYSNINNFESDKQYLSMPLSFPLKKRYVQCRLGILPIRYHTGRFEKIPESERLCQKCSLNLVDNNEHFILICPFYDNERQALLSKIDSYAFFNCKTNIDKLKLLLNDPNFVRPVACYISDCLDKNTTTFHI